MANSEPKAMDTVNLEMNPFTLAFKSPEVEGEYLGEVANRRWPVLIFIFCFDVFCFLFRFVAKWTATSADQSSADAVRPFEVLKEMGHQLCNMAMLYVLIGLLNKRARRAGNNAARQEEVLLSIAMGLAICNLLASLRADNAQDYVYMGYFLICTSTFLKIRWWVGTGLLATPTVAVQLWHSQPPPSSILPPDAVVHIVVAWAVGGLMAYLNDWYRRQMYAHARLASAAHDKEMMEATARIQAQRELAAAQAQAAQRALIVAREKAAHEAKSEFMSLMCHEVRTPLNGCLASAEMLLETTLKEEQRELANTIRVSGSILLSTVSNFLDFFKLEAGKRLDIVRSEVYLPDLVGDVHCIIEAMIGRTGSVSLQQPQLLDVPDRVFADPDRLRGILLNLYTNAAKFTKRGHIVLRVHCVNGDYTPPAKAGYSAIMLQPTYHVSSSSHRSMDITSSITMEPASEDSEEQKDEQQQQQPEQQDDHTTQPVPAADATTAVPVSPRRSRKARRRSGARVSFHDQQPQQVGEAEQSPLDQQVCVQHQALWNQASQWALSLLSPAAVHSLWKAATAASTAEHNWQCSADQHTNHSPSSHEGLPDVGRKRHSSEISNGGLQYDVHASTLGSALRQHEAVGDPPPLQQSTSSSTSGDCPGEQTQTAVPPPTPPAVPPAAGSTSWRRNSNSSDDACWLLFEVEDTGVGITRDGLAMLFREYVQGTEDEMCKPRTRGGTGLGLSICSKQVGVLGGVIGAHSCRGQGSMFWFKIPTYVRLGKSRSTDSSRSQQRMSLEQQQWSGNEQTLSADTSPQQQEQQQQLQHVCPSTDQTPAAPLVSAGASGSASNVGTHSVIHSGLYHSSKRQEVGSGAAFSGESSSTVPQAAAASRAGGNVHADQADIIRSRPVADSSSQQPGAAAAARPPLRQRMSGDVVSLGNSTSASANLPRQSAAVTAGPSPAVAAAGAAVSATASTRSSTAAATLPRARQSLSLDGRTSSGPSLDTQRLLGKRVLLAEDNLINQTVARKMLSSLGMQVGVAFNGLEALNAVEQAGQAAASGAPGKMFALVLMDMAMPVMGGVEATKAIRAAGHNLPIVAMTANASDSDRDECASAGMDGFLSKPVLRDQLARAMLAALDKHGAALVTSGCANHSEVASECAAEQ